MRGVLVGDLEYAVAALLSQDPAIWDDIARAMITQAHLADCARKRLGRAHPQFGTGSLMSAASKRARSRRRNRCDATYCAALAVVLAALRDWRADPSRGCTTCSAAPLGQHSGGQDPGHRHNPCSSRIRLSPSAPAHP